MKKQLVFYSPALRFKRWSRRGYAAFISLKQTVTMGHLSANVSERFQTKNSSIHSSVLSNGIKTQEMENEEDGYPEESRMLSLMQIRELAGIAAIQQDNCRVTIPASILPVIKNDLSIPDGFSIILEPSGIFFTNNPLYD